jgi:hypothetical protein
VTALVASGGQWIAYPGKGAADGSFVIPGVPQGPYLFWLMQPPGGLVFHELLSTSARVLDLSGDSYGRPDQALSSASTAISTDLQNLLPWGADDTLGCASINALGFAEGPAPSPGATSLHWSDISWENGLVDGSKGDVLYVLQHSSLTGPAGVPFSVITRAAAFPGLVQVDGAITHLSGSFAPVPVKGSVALDFRATQFAALGPAIHPSITGGGPVHLGIYAAPGGGQYFGLDLLSLDTASDANLGTVAYASPFPAAWVESVRVAGTFTVALPVPGASNSWSESGGTYTGLLPAQAGAGPIVPVLGPPREPRISGTSAFEMPTGTTTTPTISWKPPAFGTPAGYEVVVQTVDIQNGMATLGGRVEIYTNDTSITLPPCILTEGSPYLVSIDAISTSTGVDFASHPYRRGIESAEANVITSFAIP